MSKTSNTISAKFSASSEPFATLNIINIRQLDLDRQCFALENLWKITMYIKRAVIFDKQGITFPHKYRAVGYPIFDNFC